MPLGFQVMEVRRGRRENKAPTVYAAPEETEVNQDVDSKGQEDPRDPKDLLDLGVRLALKEAKVNQERWACKDNLVQTVNQDWKDRQE